MKKKLRTGWILIWAIAFAFAFNGCEKEVLPTASFTYEPTDIVQYVEIQFANTSTDADSYLWDFGNGEVSTEENPKKIFMQAGTVTVKLTATNGDGTNISEQTITVNAHDNHYMLGDTKIAITTDLFWYQSPRGGDPYLRLLTPVASQENPDLLKLHPNKGLGELAQTYTWAVDGAEETYDHGYSANQAGMNYDWTAIGKTGSSELLIEEVETGVYKITGNLILSVGNYDWSTGDFNETSVKTLTLSYVGAITALP